MKRTVLPIGIDNFSTLVRGTDSKGNHYLFLDKSLLIQEIIDNGAMVTLITRPRRFGKTLNLSMLQYFFSKEVNGVATEGLFTGLKVADHPEVMTYQGQSPVLFITLKDIKGNTFEAMLGMLKSELVGLCKAHEYLLDSIKVRDWQKVVFESFLTESAKPAAYKRAFQFLCELLYQHR